MEKDKEILYEAEVIGLKSADKGKRILRTILIFVLEILFLLGLALIFGNILIPAIIFLVCVLVFIPSPMLIVPSKYRVMKNGVDCDGKRTIPFKKGYKANMNLKRKFVSILHSRRGELVRLYTNEPKKLLNIIRSSALK